MQARCQRGDGEKLIDLLSTGMPVFVIATGRRKGDFDMTRLSSLLGVTRQSLWTTVVKRNSISADIARKLIELKCCSLTANDLLPYIR